MSAPETSPLARERDGSVMRLVLDRPQAGNTVSLSMAQALMRAAIECDEDDSIRCVLLTGRGRMFCAGGDIAEFAAAGEGIGAYLKEVTACLHAAVLRFRHMAKPLMVAVNGPAAGAGFSLAVAGDIVLAAPDARFVAAYGALGYTPDGGLSWLLPRLVGMRQAQEILLANRAIGGEEAVTIGLATRLVPSAELVAEAARQATVMAAAATGAIGRTRSLLAQAFDTSLETHLDAEARAIAASARTAHGREGVAAFLAKRPARFTGDENC
ncbi:enoyl-CoA hydratase/isomerase family protein [Niveispirillum sp.]|uniref:enoyl-CoA hydratase/isomerase family protein n=1 Tax=Niveispirillum sp. TaxID=1917217 RepID=UPI001B739127|nr:enoyl-CoA hydratase/isomerase family protein [Niveispirillum sp.]MBP7337408.1 enoyl-CoA hydratase/isomerase family protein [Niveispirillum sp.]